MRCADLAAVMGTVLFLFSMSTARRPIFVWNASASAPLGLYRVGDAGRLQRGEFVLARLPQTAARLAAQRAYLPLGVPVIKRVAALTGDRICSLGTAITIEGHIVAQRLTADHEGRGLPFWQGCVQLDDRHLFLLSADVPDSFDGRYFGPVQREAILGKAMPLWTW